MNWHNVNKYLIRKIVISLGALLAIIMFTQNMLYDVEFIASNPLIRVFTEEFFYTEIIQTYNMWFSVIMLTGPVLLLLTGRDYGKDYKSGVISYICAIAIMVVSIVAYIVTTLLVLKVYAVGLLVMGVVALILLVLMIVNITYYRKHKDILVGDGNKKFDKAGIIIICLVALTTGGVLVGEYNSTRKECYTKFKDRCIDRACDVGFVDWNGNFYKEDINYNYIYLQYVNLFNIEGKSYTYDELMDAIEDFENDGDQWFVLWDLCHMCRETYGWGDEITESDLYAFVDFGDYGVDKADRSIDFSFLVGRELNKNNIKINKATFEQIDEACLYVYNQYHSQENPIILGDEPGEIKVTIDISDSKLVNDVELSCEGEGYFVNLGSWYEVAEAGEERGDQDRVTELTTGKIYVTTLTTYSYMEYIMAKNMLIDVDGVDCTILEVQPSAYGGYTPNTYIWVKIN